MDKQPDTHPQDEHHIAGCATCQARFALEGLDVNLEKVWQGVVAGVWSRPVSRTERLLGSLLHSPGLARALLTTPSLLPSWLLATAAVLTVGVFFTYSTGQPWVALLAPALAGASIAYAYGPGIDPAFELAQSLPVSHRTVLLVRAFTVFALNALLGLAASLVAGELSLLTASWLIPMSAVSALALTISLLSHSANTGVFAAFSGWALIVLGGRVATEQWAAAVTDATLMPFYLLVAALMTVVILRLADESDRRKANWR